MWLSKLTSKRPLIPCIGPSSSGSLKPLGFLLDFALGLRQFFILPESQFSLTTLQKVTLATIMEYIKGIHFLSYYLALLKISSVVILHTWSQLVDLFLFLFHREVQLLLIYFILMTFFSFVKVPMLILRILLMPSLCMVIFQGVSWEKSFIYFSLAITS